MAGAVPLEVLPRAAGVLRDGVGVGVGLRGEGEDEGEGGGEPLPVYERAPEYRAVEIVEGGEVGNLREVLETVRA